MMCGGKINYSAYFSLGRPAIFFWYEPGLRMNSVIQNKMHAPIGIPTTAFWTEVSGGAWPAPKARRPTGRRKVRRKARFNMLVELNCKFCIWSVLLTFLQRIQF